MKDPKPTNIDGRKIAQHSVEWEVNVGHVLLGLAIIYVAYEGSQLLSEGNYDTGGVFTTE